MSLPPLSPPSFSNTRPCAHFQPKYLHQLTSSNQLERHITNICFSLLWVGVIFCRIITAVKLIKPLEIMYNYKLNPQCIYFINVLGGYREQAFSCSRVKRYRALSTKVWWRAKIFKVYHGNSKPKESDLLVQVRDQRAFRSRVANRATTARARSAW